MKIIKEGKLPTPTKVLMVGTCNHCGCIVQEEYESNLVQYRRIYTVKCPTHGCVEDILMFPTLPKIRQSISCNK